MKIIGILNVTPDSFSDGGEGNHIERAHQMIADGAAIIDIGAESTRPGAETLSYIEEVKRLLPVLEKLSYEITVSIDTRNYQIAKEAAQFPNVKYLNDVSGFSDPRMLEEAAQNNLTIIAMHSLTVPADKNTVITDASPLGTICQWIKNKSMEFKNYLPSERIIFDPGLGFGKTAAQSTELIERAGELADLCHNLGTKILYGHSRKSFLGVGTITQRDLETARISNYLQKQGVDYIRVHNVGLNARAIFWRKRIKVKDLRALIEKSLDESKALEVVVIDLKNKTDIADFMIIASGTSSRHVNAISERLLEELRHAGIKGISPKAPKAPSG